MKIGIDIDNTINNLTQAALEVYNADSGDYLPICNIKDYNISKFVKPEYRENFQAYFSDPRVWNKVRPTKSCVSYIERLTKEGHNIYFVTATCPDMVERKAQWVSKYFPFINVNFNFIVCANKQLLSGLDILIDDYIDNLTDTQCYGILVTQPWNDYWADKCGDKTFFCTDWSAVYDTINHIKELEQNESNKT